MNVTTMAEFDKAVEFLVMVARWTGPQIVKVEPETHIKPTLMTVDLWVHCRQGTDLVHTRTYLQERLDIAMRLFEAPAGVRFQADMMVREEGETGDAYEAAYRLCGDRGVSALRRVREQ